MTSAAAEKAELLAIIKARSYRFGNFTLASGRESQHYFDLKPTMMHARGAYLCARTLLRLLEPLKVDYVAGLEMGAVPVIASLAALSVAQGRPVESFFVRKAPKTHGTTKVIEGLTQDESLAGKRVIIIDDVITTAGSSMKAVDAVRAAGGIIEHALCIVDRQEGGAENFKAAGITLHAVLKKEDFA